jgi:hypothetical protein
MPSKVHLQSKIVPRARFRTGVSLHSHTLYSRESLQFIYHAGARNSILAAVIRNGEQRYRQFHGTDLDLRRGWWTPPLGPHEAWALEKTQIENLGLGGLVSLTDHDDIEAPVSLHLLDECRETPVSFEWTVPYASTFFHLGVHNLPVSEARALFERMDEYRRSPRPEQLVEILAEVAAAPETLVVFNHPLWDESGIGVRKHVEVARRFLQIYGPYLHALELNGLRPWRENSGVVSLAAEFDKPVISGGDRHGVEANAMLNLTNAATFSEFVEEVRSGWSDVLILSHYHEPHALRIVHNMIDVLRIRDEHANGWRLWSDRVFYACDDGRTRSLTELFGAKPPFSVALFLGAVQFASAPQVRRLMRGAFPAEEKISL